MLLIDGLILFVSCSDDTVRSHSQDPGWRIMNSGTTENLQGVWGADDDNVFAVGDNGTILHYNSTEWTKMNSGTTRNLRSIWGGSLYVIAVGDSGTVLRNYGDIWREEWHIPTSEPLGAVWCSDHTIYVLGGTPGTVLLYDDSHAGYWEIIETGASERFIDLIGFTDYYHGSYPLVIAVGRSGTAYWGGGYHWFEMDSATDEDLVTLFGESPANVYSIGSNGTIIQNTGRFLMGAPDTTWCEVDNLNAGQLHDMTARSYNDIFIVGDGGRIFNFNRCRFEEMPTGSSATLRAVWSGKTDVFAVGDNGTILRYSTIPSAPNCPVNVIVSASGGTTPTISWSPSCPVTKLFMENQRGDVQWFIACDGNLIEPSVEYGIVPDCAVEFCPMAMPLAEGEWYRIGLIRRDWGNEYIIGSWNIMPQDAKSGAVVKVAPHGIDKLGDFKAGSSSSLAIDYGQFYVQRLIQTIPGTEIFAFGGVSAVRDWGRRIPDPAVRKEELNIRPVIVERLVYNPGTQQNEVITYSNIRAAGTGNAPIVWDWITPDQLQQESTPVGTGRKSK